jgi:mRNA interferase HigB
MARRSHRPICSENWLTRSIATWTTCTSEYESACHQSNRRLAFNIKGNDYRLIVAVAYRFGAIYIKFIGTHAEYDAIDAETIEMEL